MPHRLQSSQRTDQSCCGDPRLGSGINRYDGNAFVVYKNRPQSSGSRAHDGFAGPEQRSYQRLSDGLRLTQSSGGKQTAIMEIVTLIPRMTLASRGNRDSRWRLGQEHRPGQSRFSYGLAPKTAAESSIKRLEHLLTIEMTAMASWSWEDQAVLAEDA